MSLTQPYLPAYRRPLFQRVYDQLQSVSIDLRLFHLDPGADRLERGEAVTAPWAQIVPGRRWNSPAGALTLERLPAGWSRPDLLVTGLAAGNVTAWLAAGRRQRFVLLGHGSSGNSGFSRVGQQLENQLIRRAQHTLTYLPSAAAAVVAAAGVSADSVSAFLNTSDSAALRARRDAVTAGEVAAFAAAHGLRVGAPTVLSVGRMDTVKRLDLLVAAIVEIRRRLPDLQVVVGGRGPSEGTVRALADSDPAVVWLGRMGPRELALASCLGHVLLHPGGLGLVAVDALALNLLVITAAGATHGPEIEYLRPGVDLQEVPADPAALARAVVDALAAGRPPVRADGDYPTVEGAADRIAACVVDVLRRQP